MKDIFPYVFETNRYGLELLADVYFKHNDEGMRDPHQLDYYELTLVKQGRGKVFFDYEAHPLTSNTIFFTPPGPVRAWRTDGAFEALAIIFKAEFLSAFFNDPMFLYKLAYFHHDGLRWSLTTSTELFDGYWLETEDMYGEIQALKQDSGHMLRASLYRMLVKLNRMYGDLFGVASDTGDLTLMQRLRSLIEQHFGENRQVAFYADELHITADHLNHCIKRSTGKTVSAHIRERVITEIKRLLLHTNLSAAEITWKLNFKDPSYLARYFKVAVGVSPLAYKKRVRLEIAM